MKPWEMMRRFGQAASATAGGTDDFSTDTTASYTMTQDSGSPTAAIAGGVLTITSPAGCQASLTRNGTNILDGYVEADIDTAEDSGLLLRFQDQNNFYLRAICDDSGSNPSRNIWLWKRVAGTFSAIASYDASWARGTQNTIKFYASGTSIKAALNGADVISVTDSAISAAGKIGMRGNGPPAGTANNKLNALRWG